MKNGKNKKEHKMWKAIKEAWAAQYAKLTAAWKSAWDNAKTFIIAFIKALFG
jgi:transposase-like protein